MRHLFPSEGEGCNGDRFWVRPPRPSQRQQFRSDCSDPLQRPRPELGSSSAPELPEESGGASLLPLAPDHSARSLGPSALGLSPSLPSKRSNPLASSSEPWRIEYFWLNDYKEEFAFLLYGHKVQFRYSSSLPTLEAYLRPEAVYQLNLTDEKVWLLFWGQALPWWKKLSKKERRKFNAPRHTRTTTTFARRQFRSTAVTPSILFARNRASLRASGLDLRLQRSHHTA